MEHVSLNFREKKMYFNSNNFQLEEHGINLQDKLTVFLHIQVLLIFKMKL